MVFCVTVSAPRGNQVDDPSKKPGGANPAYSGHKDPEDTNDDSSVIDLARAGEKKAKNARDNWVAHRQLPPGCGIRILGLYCSLPGGKFGPLLIYLAHINDLSMKSLQQLLHCRVLFGLFA
jgi:hypothetical protein